MTGHWLTAVSASIGSASTASPRYSVRGGGRLHGRFFDAGLVDRVAAFVAPVIVGGATAPGPVEGRGFSTMAEAVRLTDVRFHHPGEDRSVEDAVSKPQTLEVA